MEAPQNRRFYGKMECLHIWPTYWELLGTCWEQMKNEKNPPLPKHQASIHSHTKLKNLGFSFELVRVEMLCLFKNMRMCHDGV